ncbi:hypothetical protein FGB62_187g20 [Gracilaria domingensis]|nr:hypothetical protein FGB62_187g20 [Gracilaria domingensis]
MSARVWTDYENDDSGIANTPVRPAALFSRKRTQDGSNSITITCNQDSCVSEHQEEFECNTLKPDNDDTLLLLFASSRVASNAVVDYQATIPKSEGIPTAVSWKSVRNLAFPTQCARVPPAPSNLPLPGGAAGQLPGTGQVIDAGSILGVAGTTAAAAGFGRPFGSCCFACPRPRRDFACCRACSFF